MVILSSAHAIQTRDPAVYLMPGEKEAFEWIQTSTPPNSIIAAAPKTGLLIPAYTGRRVIYGHPFETIQAEKEKTWVENLYQTGGDGPALSRLISSRPIDYVFFGPREAQLGTLTPVPGLLKVYDADGVQIYRHIQ